MSKQELPAIDKIGLLDLVQASSMTLSSDPLSSFHHSFGRFDLKNILFSSSILAPTMYIFFASALPVIAFGEQLSKDTGRHAILTRSHPFYDYFLNHYVDIGCFKQMEL